MSDTNPILTSVESLQIEDSTGAIINPATAEGQDIIVVLTRILEAIQYPRIADMTNNSDRVTIATGSVSLNTNQTLATLTNLQQLNGVQSELVPRMAEYASWQALCRTTIS